MTTALLSISQTIFAQERLSSLGLHLLDSADGKVWCKAITFNSHREEREVNHVIDEVIGPTGLSSREYHSHNALHVLAECRGRDILDNSLQELESPGVVGFRGDEFLLDDGENAGELSRARELSGITA